MKKIISASVLSLLLFGAISLNEIETGKFEVRDTLEERFTNKVTGKKVTVKRAAEGEASVSEVKIQQRYDEESRSYDFRFVAGINTVELDKARITITLGDGKTASKDLFAAYTKMVVGEEEQTASQVFGEGYDYLLAYVLSDVPAAAVTTAFDVNIGLVAEESVVAEAERNVKLSDIVDLDFTPSIEFANNDELAVVAGSAIELPTYTLTNGVSSVAEVKITSENGVVADGKYTPDQYSEQGTHRLTYTAVNPDTGKEVVVGYRDVNVYRKMFLSQDNTFKVENELSINENQTISCSNGGFATSRFNMRESLYYYAETTFIKKSGVTFDNGHKVGLTHWMNSNRGFSTVLGLGNFDMNAKDFSTNGSNASNDSWNLDTNAISVWQTANNLLKPISTADTEIKISTIRMNDTFYYFVNNKYLASFVEKAYKGVPTIPGYVLHNPNAGITMKDIRFSSNEAAVNEKYNELTENGKGLFTGYVARGYDWAADSKNTNNKNFTANEYSEERGLNFDFTNATLGGENSGMVSMYQYLEGNFTVEWDYVKTGNNTQSGNQFMWMELRPSTYGDDLVRLCTKFNGGSNSATIEQHTKTRNADGSWAETWSSGIITNHSAGYRYSFTRVLSATEATYTMVTTSLADPTQVVTKVTKSSYGSWNTRSIILWKNQNVSGQYSNVKIYPID